MPNINLKVDQQVLAEWNSFIDALITEEDSQRGALSIAIQSKSIWDLFLVIRTYPS